MTKPRWRFSGAEIDHGDACETCELCGQMGLRYHFELTDIAAIRSNIWVGSTCILKFAELDQFGQAIDPDRLATYLENRKHVMAKTRQRALQEHAERLQMEADARRLWEREQHALGALQALLEREADASFRTMIESVMEQYELKKFMSPRQSAVIFWRFKKAKVAYDPKDFNIDINNQWKSIRAMTPYQINAILPSLSLQDRERVRQMRE